VRRGGIVTKLPQWRVARKKWLLAVEDPQVSGLHCTALILVWRCIIVHCAHIDNCSFFDCMWVAWLLLCQLGRWAKAPACKRLKQA
jgi:hypothetical protein